METVEWQFSERYSIVSLYTMYSGHMPQITQKRDPPDSTMKYAGILLSAERPKDGCRAHGELD